MERNSLSHRTTLICGQGLLDCPGDQALKGITGKFKIREDMYMDLFEGLFLFLECSFHNFHKTSYLSEGLCLEPRGFS